MNKGLGATTFGAILLAGFLFQVKPGTSPSASQRNTAPAQSATKPLTGEGPWMASCKYWAEAHSFDPPTASDTSPDLDVTLHVSGKVVESHIKSAPAPEPTCGSRDSWGIPLETSTPRPEISAIVATIPDPIHSHLALDFDRSIDAILLAAADNGYLSSYYWLPWRSHASSVPTSESASISAPKDDNSGERQPGLIILRYAPNPNYWTKESDDVDPKEHPFSRSAYYCVV
jgi:hypothetical protein